MFEFPEAKRARREELNGSDSSDTDGSADEGYYDALRAKLNAQMAQSLDLSEPKDHHGFNGAASIVEKARDHAPSVEASARPDGEEGLEEEEEEAYDFRLFGSASVSKVVLEHDELPKGEGGLVKSGRPLSYYMVTDVSAEQKRQYGMAAVSGDDVLTRSHWKTWGWEFPQRVMTIAATKKPGQVSGAQELEDEKDPKRRRPGKKRRIAIRTKERKKQAKVEAKAQQLAEKEEHVKDKKKRMNRLKKLRKRAKARELKAANGEGGEGAEASEDESAGSE